MKSALTAFRPIALFAVVLALAPFTSVAESGGPSADEVLRKMQKAMWPGKDMRSHFEVRVTNDLGEQAYMTGAYYRKGETPGRTVQRFLMESPPELRGFDLAG